MNNEEIKELINKMTLDEKIGMVHGAELFRTKGVERLGIPPLSMTDGPMGVRNEFCKDNWATEKNATDNVTYLPCNSALCSTWNRSLAYKMGEVLGNEVRGRGKDVSLAPGINIKRNPLCGRNFEYFSEDPYLTGEMAKEVVKGAQSKDIACCVKHFALNNKETKRLEYNANIDEDVLKRIYLRAFRKVLIDGGALSVMSAYNKYKNVFCSDSKELLKDILRDEWGYDGAIISDWGAVHDTDKAAHSELDLEMSVTDNFDEYFLANPLKEKILSGDIDEKLLDKKVYHLLTLMDKLNMLGKERNKGAYNAPESREITRLVALDSIILLENKDNVLPLDEKKLRNVLVIGENADRIHSNAGGSAEIKALYEITPLMGLRMALGGNCKVDFAEGYTSRLSADDPSVFENGGTNWDRIAKIQETEKNWQATSLENGGGGKQKTAPVDDKLKRLRKELRDKAVEMAQDPKYDAVIFVGGLNHDYDSEGVDRANMYMPYEQNELIEELSKVRNDVISVVVTGSPVGLEKVAENSKALLLMYYNGMEGGNALASTLLGYNNPSGKLAETFGHDEMDYGVFAMCKRSTDDEEYYDDGFKVGYRFNDTENVSPLYPFGYGISYTSFEYKNADIVCEDKDKYITVEVSNTGDMDGAEILQVYVKREGVEVEKELAGFEKVFIGKGESTKVKIKIELEDETDISKKLNENDVTYLIAASSKDIRITL